MKTRVAIVGIIKHKGKVLLLKRALTKKHSPGLWEFAGGFLHEGETTEDCIVREVKEETRLDGKVVRRGKAFETEDQWGKWIVIPHLISVKSGKVKKSREHTECRWISVKDVKKFKCVVSVGRDLKTLKLL